MLIVIMQLLVSGIAMGFVYGLVGIEYTLIWNSTGLLNFSHERIIMLGAYAFAGTWVLGVGLSPVPAIAATIITLVIFAVLVSLAIFIPLRNMSRICAIMSTVMLGNIINEGVRLIYGPEALKVKGFLTGTVRIGMLAIAKGYLVIIGVAFAILLLLTLFMRRTRTGKAMRCVASNKNASALMGIDVQRNMIITIAISFVICCVIGIMIIPLYSVNQSMASMISLKGFAAGVIGGFGSLPGAIVGGLVIGIIENVGGMIFPSTFKDVVAFVCLITMLLLRPAGILGKKSNG